MWHEIKELVKLLQINTDPSGKFYDRSYYLASHKIIMKLIIMKLVLRVLGS